MVEYVIYGAAESQRMRPMSNGAFCVNLIHADHYTAFDIAAAAAHAEELTAANPGFLFSARIVPAAQRILIA